MAVILVATKVSIHIKIPPVTMPPTHKSFFWILEWGMTIPLSVPTPTKESASY